MKTIILVLFAGLLTFGCAKEETPAPAQVADCVKFNTGTFKIHNSTDEGYNIYCNGAFIAVVNAYSDYSFVKGVNTYTLEFKEKDYFLVQNVYSGTYSLDQCQTRTIYFGNKQFN